MEPVKPLEQFFDPDPRMTAFVTRPIGSSEWRATTVSDHYGDLDGLDLNPGVPESMVNYINVIKNLYLYGWLCYPFFTANQTLAAMAVEMALRLRMPEAPGKEHRRTLKPLLKAAIAKGVIQDSGFPSLPEKQAEARQFYEHLEQELGINTVTHIVELLNFLAPCWGTPEVLAGADLRWMSNRTADAMLTGALKRFWKGWDRHFLGVRRCAPEDSSAVNLQHYFHVNKIPSLAAGIIETPVAARGCAVSVISEPEGQPTMITTLCDSYHRQKIAHALASQT